jgi:hypothetical protein
LKNNICPLSKFINKDTQCIPPSKHVSVLIIQPSLFIPDYRN